MRRTWLIDHFRHSVAAQMLILAAAVFIFYFDLWNAYFATLDDFWWLGHMRYRETIIDAARGMGEAVRYLNFVAIWLKARLFDMNATPYYLLGMVQHIIVTYLVYWLTQFWVKKRSVAFLAALLFATKFSFFEVITTISATEYSLWAIFYLVSLGCFATYLEYRRLSLYLISMGVFVVMAFGFDFTLTLPPVLLAYHVLYKYRSLNFRSLTWSDIKLHLPFWIFWVGHVALQLFYILAGTSEAIYSEESYVPGSHIPGNLFYLVFLIVPNIKMAAIHNFVLSFLGSEFIDVFWIGTIGLAVLAHIVAAISFWIGSPIIRFALALIYIPFLPYLLWTGSFAGAPRYLYIPSIGFSILLAIFLINIHELLSMRHRSKQSIIVPSVIVVILMMNLVMTQIWVQRHVENGAFRRPFVTQLAKDFNDVEAGTKIYIEVPERKFTDLSAACRLVLKQQVSCNTFVRSELSNSDLTRISQNKRAYWLLVTPLGYSRVSSPVTNIP